MDTKAQANSQGSVQFNHSFLQHGFSYISFKAKQTNDVSMRKCLQHQVKGVHYKWDRHIKDPQLNCPTGNPPGRTPNLIQLDNTCYFFLFSTELAHVGTERQESKNKQ